MAENERHSAPGVVAPSTRVTVAFPFSQVRTQEASAELRELATIVAEVVETLAQLDPPAASDELLQRTRALVTKLA